MATSGARVPVLNSPCTGVLRARKNEQNQTRRHISLHIPLTPDLHHVYCQSLFCSLCEGAQNLSKGRGIPAIWTLWDQVTRGENINFFVWLPVHHLSYLYTINDAISSDRWFYWWKQSYLTSTKYRRSRAAASWISVQVRICSYSDDCNVQYRNPEYFTRCHPFRHISHLLHT